MKWLSLKIVHWALNVFLVSRVLGASIPSAAQSSTKPAFTYNRHDFMLHGEPYQIIGGQMDPQRIPPAYWRDRLSKARAMGLNTIFSYVYWNLMEPQQGSWTSHEPENNIAEYFKIAQEEELHIVLRPGPYICGEREWGGFPAWLSEVPGMVVRANNQPFLKAAETYLDKLASDVADLQVTRGGPILMVQVENEYGSFGNDHHYTAAIKDMLRANFEVSLYTNDGGLKSMIQGGEVPGVLAEIDGSPANFESRDKYVTNVTELGPWMDGEYYTYWLDTWGSSSPHGTTQGNSSLIDPILKDIDYVLGNVSSSISFYMFHGGSNFGFSNGGLWQNRTLAVTSSYDYGAPLDESGRMTDLYKSIRETIEKYVPSGSIPEPSLDLPRMSVSEFELLPVKNLFDCLDPAISSETPLTMEALGQAYGFTLYEHTASSNMKGLLQPGDRARDRVLVYINESIVGVIDSQYHYPQNVSIDLNVGDKLQLLVENLGRVDYYSRTSSYQNYLQDPWKGIKGNVTIGGRVVSDWRMKPIPLDQLPLGEGALRSRASSSSSSSPVFYKGSFKSGPILQGSTMTLDTFLAVPNGIKGIVWVNGFNLGRYWLIGPQQSLYLPGTIVKPDSDNEVVVLELEPWNMNKTSMMCQGLDQREWGNNPDPDCLNCI